MMTPFDLSAPSVTFDATMRWLLRVAFKTELDEPPPLDQNGALALARRVELSGRVYQRLNCAGSTGMSTELVRGLAEDYYTNLAVEALLRGGLDRAAELAARTSVPVIALKYAGLNASRVIEPGTRVVCDIDLLISEEQAKFFWQALLGAGFVRTRGRAYPHQLEALVDPYGAVLELHLNVPGVFLAPGHLATASGMIARRLVAPSMNSILVPSKALLAAHALAHGIVQNFATPQSYSPLRMLADLADLRRAQPDVLFLAEAYLDPETARVCRAAEELCAALAAGAIGEAGLEDPEADRLLRHCVAARCDVDYASRLRAMGLKQKLSDGSSWTQVFGYIGRTLFPSESELDAIYGPQAAFGARLRRRLMRPVDVSRRSARHWLSRRSR